MKIPTEITQILTVIARLSGIRGCLHIWKHYPPKHKNIDDIVLGIETSIADLIKAKEALIEFKNQICTD